MPKISALPAASTPDGTEALVAVQSAADVAITTDQLATRAISLWTVISAAGSSRTFTGSGNSTQRTIATLDQSTCAITITLSNNQAIDLQLVQGSGGSKAATWTGVDQWFTTTGSAPASLVVTAGASDRFYFEKINGTTYGYWLTGPVLDATDLPWTINLEGWAYSASSVAFPSPSVNALYFGNYTQDYTGTQFDWLAWNVLVSPGTWVIKAVYRTTTSSGILSFKIGGTVVATIDALGGSTVENNVTTTSSFTISAVGKVVFTVAIDSKNSGSGGYAGRISQLALIRTA